MGFGVGIVEMGTLVREIRYGSTFRVVTSLSLTRGSWVLWDLEIYENKQSAHLLTLRF